VSIHSTVNFCVRKLDYLKDIWSENCLILQLLTWLENQLNTVACCLLARLILVPQVYLLNLR
jgi:hypothetical protein